MLCLIAAMNIIDVIRGCTLIGEIEMLECLFELSESEKQASFKQRLVIRVNELLQESTEQEKREPEIFPKLMDGWSKEERRSFEDDWNDDSFLADLVESTLPDRIYTRLGKERLSFENDWDDDWNDDSFLAGLVEPATPDVLSDPIHIGEGSSIKRSADLGGAKASKIPKTVPLFTIKSVKQVKVKKFKTTGLDYKIQFDDLQVRGIFDVILVVKRLNESIFTCTIIIHCSQEILSHLQERLR